MASAMSERMTVMPLPIRISVRVDFDDGSEHTYEVRGPDAVPAPGGFWPEGVVTTDVAQRIEYARKRAEEIGRLKAEVQRLRSDRAYYRSECGQPSDAEDLEYLRDAGAIK